MELDEMFVGFIVPGNDCQEMSDLFSETLAHHSLSKALIALWLWPRALGIAATTIIIFFMIVLIIGALFAILLIIKKHRHD